MKKIVILLILFSLFGCQKEEVKTSVDDVIVNQEVVETIDGVILQLEDLVVTIAPEDYDGDAHDMFVDDIYTLDVLDTAIYWEIFRNVVEKDGVQTVDETSREITKAEFEEMLEYGSLYVYLDLNSARQVVKITVWGEIIVYE